MNAAVVSEDTSMGSPIAAIVVTVMPRFSASDKTYLRDHESDIRARSVMVPEPYANRSGHYVRLSLVSCPANKLTKSATDYHGW